MAHAARRILVALVILLLAPLAALAPAASGHGGHEPPTLTFHTPRAWFVPALRDGVTVTATACASQGHLRVIEIGDGAGDFEAVEGDAPCLTGHFHFHPRTPGLYNIEIYAVDDEGAAAYLGTQTRVELLPFDTSSVEGFPRLEEMPECALGIPGPSIALEFLLSPDAVVRDYRVTVGGKVCAEGAGPVVAEPGDGFAVVAYSRGVGTAHVQTDWGAEYSGGVRQYDAHWWHMVPLFQFGTEFEDLQESLP